MCVSLFNDGNEIHRGVLMIENCVLELDWWHGEYGVESREQWRFKGPKDETRSEAMKNVLMVVRVEPIDFLMSRG